MEQTESKTIIEAVKELHKAEILEVEHPDDGDLQARFIVTPTGLKITSAKALLDEFRNVPERTKGTAVLETLESFVEHVKRFLGESSSVLFAQVHTESRPSIQAVYDYHRANGPDWAQHRAIYMFPLSNEWEAWAEKDCEPMSQGEFAEFVEERILDVLDPSNASEKDKNLAEQLGATFALPARLLELSRGLKVHVGATVKQAVNTSTGEVAVSFEARHTGTDGETLRVPQAFLIAIPCFRSGAAYKLPVRLRYRVSEGRVTWSYSLIRPERVLEHAVVEACERARTETGLTLFYGSPET